MGFVKKLASGSPCIETSIMFKFHADGTLSPESFDAIYGAVTYLFNLLIVGPDARTSGRHTVTAISHADCLFNLWDNPVALAVYGDALLPPSCFDVSMWFALIVIRCRELCQFVRDVVERHGRWARGALVCKITADCVANIRWCRKDDDELMTLVRTARLADYARSNVACAMWLRDNAVDVAIEVGNLNSAATAAARSLAEAVAPPAPCVSVKLCAGSDETSRRHMTTPSLRCVPRDTYRR